MLRLWTRTENEEEAQSKYFRTRARKEAGRAQSGRDLQDSLVEGLSVGRAGWWGQCLVPSRAFEPH